MDPIRVLLSRLTGLDFEKPRKITARTFYTRSEVVKPVLQGILEREQEERNSKFSKVELVKRRQEIAIKLWKQLSKTEQKKWEELAEVDKERRLKEWDERWQTPTSRDFQFQQMCINNLTQFFTPVLDELHVLTGLHFSVLAGGPEPADGDKINVIGIHQGTSKGDVLPTFPNAEPDGYEAVQKAYGKYLKKCFTRDECATPALQPDHPLYQGGVVDREDQPHNPNLTRKRVEVQECGRADCETTAGPISSDPVEEEEEEVDQLISDVSAPGSPINVATQSPQCTTQKPV